MGYLIYAIAFFIIYYFAEQKILKISLIKAGHRFSESFDSLDIEVDKDIASRRRKTNYYTFQKIDKVFKSLDRDKPDLSISDLDYKGIVRFKQLIDKYENNELPTYDFFAHKKHKHLIYPFSSKDDSLEILLLSTYNNTINDVFDRSPRRG